MSILQEYFCRQITLPLSVAAQMRILDNVTANISASKLKFTLKVSHVIAYLLTVV